VKLTEVDDGALIYELLVRGYTVTREKKKKRESESDREKENDKYREKEITKFPVPNARNDLGPGMVNNPIGNNPFASDEKIQAQARVGLNVLTDFVSGAIKPKENLNVVKPVSIPKVKKVTLVDIDDIMDGTIKKRK